MRQPHESVDTMPEPQNRLLMLSPSPRSNDAQAYPVFGRGDCFRKADLARLTAEPSCRDSDGRVSAAKEYRPTVPQAYGQVRVRRRQSKATVQKVEGRG
jgi:hypothetical protein